MMIAYVFASIMFLPSLGLKYTAVMVDNSSSAGGGVAIMFTVYPEGTGFWLVTGMQWFR